jgi:hypothetical protein
MFLHTYAVLVFFCTSGNQQHVNMLDSDLSCALSLLTIAFDTHTVVSSLTVLYCNGQDSPDVKKNLRSDGDDLELGECREGDPALQ